MPTEAVDDGSDAHLAMACSTPFDQLPSEMIVRAFGIDYGHVCPRDGGDLYVTRCGWPFLPHLLPANWYRDKWYATHGIRLPGSGHVYHVQTRPVWRKRLDIVVKFSRVAQEVPLEVATTFPDDISPEEIASARFNSPMEEFSLVMELRRGVYGPKDIRILTQRPLAIYAPAEQFELWRLGRSPSRFHTHWHLLAQDQENTVKAIELDIKRLYVLLYSWIKGEDAEQALHAGYISQEHFARLTPRAIRELHRKGFRVLDNKPKHLILRRRARDHTLMRRRGNRIVYGLVDFELLQRTAEYQNRFKVAQREKYWHLQSRRLEATPAVLPSHLQGTTILGVHYIFGTTADGGKLWVVGHDPELFDYFLPDRWRRTPRAKLSLTNEVYHTRTRDNIHVVYRRSRVGTQPRLDPLVACGKQMREHGYNSPFEEVAIAERLREAGILTTHPRAVYRTAHQSGKVAYLRDERRFATHAGLVTPEHVPEPVLSPNYDYYTIWGYFRGIDPQRQQVPRETYRVTDLEQAYEEGLLGKREYDILLRRIHDRMQAIGFSVEGIEDYEFVVAVGAAGRLQRDDRGQVDVRLCIDAQTAYEYGLLSEEAYRDLLERMAENLTGAGWEHLNLVGHHLLLSMRAGGALEGGTPSDFSATLCNLEFIRVAFAG